MMLTREKMAEITCGAVEVSEQDGYFVFSRMTERERNVYRSHEVFYRKAHATAGVMLDFITDATSLGFSYRYIWASSRHTAFFDVYVNERLRQSVGDDEAPVEFGGEYRLTLPDGTNRVTIVMPNLYELQIKDFDVVEATVLLPVQKDITMVAYGDSITQGYDAAFPSFSYVNRVARSLNACVHNKAIGGDRFCPELLDAVGQRDVDLVTVAYGTNDWHGGTREDLLTKAPRFLDAVDRQYPQATIVVITPIWRADEQDAVPFGTFEELTRWLDAEARKHPRFHTVRGVDLLPHLTRLFADGYLHPNELGMEIYAAALLRQIQEWL